MEENKEVTYTTNFTFILFVVFLILKLTGYITWSWWIVTLPLWIGPVIGLGIVGVCLALMIVIGIPLGILYLIYKLFDK